MTASGVSGAVVETAVAKQSKQQRAHNEMERAHNEMERAHNEMERVEGIEPS